MWFIPGIIGWCMYRGQIAKKVAWKTERWDYEDKYWREGHWIKEFPEGLCQVTYANGATSIEPGRSSTDWKNGFKKFIFQLHAPNSA